MAPRTPEQQKEYNAKRRAETAAKKAQPKQDIAAQVKALGADSLLPKGTDTFVSKRTSKTYYKGKTPHEKQVKAGATKTTKVAKPKLPPRKLFAAKTAAAKPIKGVDPETRREVLAGKVPPRVVSTPPLPVPAQNVPAEGHAPLLLARSYRREYKGVGATVRGNMLQVTVTFSKDQFNVLKERADLYNCSLSEAVRKCVMSGPLPN